MWMIYFLLSLCVPSFASFPIEENFYAPKAKEQVVEFDGVFLTEWKSLSSVMEMNLEEREQYKHLRVFPTLKFLFGPLTNRQIGNPQRGETVELRWLEAKMQGDRVALPYSYRGTWILSEKISSGFSLPVPLDAEDLYTPNWKRCTDSHPDHQNSYYYWYYWDPDRYGCEHKQMGLYQTVKVKFGEKTVEQSLSFPEYEKLLQGGTKRDALRMTFAFGYVEDVSNPKPDSDRDAGMRGYQDFLSRVRVQLSGFQETDIRQGEYLSAGQPNVTIGHRFTGKWNNQSVVVNVVAAAGIDQMEIFAKSFAHDHDSFFGWLGHSRVGSGFDADRFRSMLKRNPDYYTISSQYQLVYWGGCNSYSYYTLPFFDIKARASGGLDPKGTKGLDIIANGLPSYFHLNAENADIIFEHLLNFESKPSYQTILQKIEDRAGMSGIDVLVAVLGDEDNQN